MARSKKTTREPSKMVRVDEAMEILSVSKSPLTTPSRSLTMSSAPRVTKCPAAAFPVAISWSGAAYE